MESFKNIRIGTGLDAHAFTDDPDSKVILGGIEIDHDKGLAGHSDADVLIHAIVDALLGAIRLGDIGEHFSSDKAEWKGAPSRKFLEWTRDRLKERHAEIVNIDSCILAQAPRIKPHVEAMQKNLAEILGIDDSRVSVKATTTDHLGFVGRKEGIACQASALVLLKA